MSLEQPRLVQGVGEHLGTVPQHDAAVPSGEATQPGHHPGQPGSALELDLGEVHHLRARHGRHHTSERHSRDVPRAFATLGPMLSLIADDLAAYVERHASSEPPLLAELRDETRASLEDPQMQVGIVEGMFLKLVVAITGSRRVLEIGTYSGYSTLCMASALPDDGRIITLDRDPKAVELARKYFDRSPHGAKIEPRLGDARASLETLIQEDARFDLVFLDADKENYVHYWDAVLPLLPVGGVVLADNTLWGGRVLDPQAPSDHGIVAFNEHVVADERVEQVLLSVRDGIMLARKLR